MIKCIFSLNSYFSDVSTGGRCHSLPDGTPDANCVFVVDENIALDSSIMALPYVVKNHDFCDDTEALLHDDDLPNKHNVMCSGRSTWSIIKVCKIFSRYLFD